MEEDTMESVAESMEIEEMTPDWTDQRQGDVPVRTDYGFIPTRDMATMIFVEEVMEGDDTGRCMPTCPTRSQDGQVQWMLCNKLDCYGCYFKANADRKSVV